MSTQTKKKRRRKPRSPDSPTENQTTGTLVREVTGVAEGEKSTASTKLTPLKITKQDTLIRQPKEVGPSDPVGKGTLASLLMQTGSTDALLKKEDNTWPGIARNLKAAFLPIQQGLENPRDRADYIAELGTVYYGPGKVAMFKENQESAQHTDKASDVVKFLEKFMDTNGQWAYIEKQDWFKNGEFVIGIDVNYYPDRSAYKASPIFHKDTGGNNLFVNLVFDNEKPIEATEWFADLAQPSKKRTSWQKDLVPEAYLDELDQSRKALQGQFDKYSRVSGGVSEAPHTYVSWVDDLVWHATPTDKMRIKYSAKAAKAAYTDLHRASNNDDFAYSSKRFKRNILGVEILGTIAESKDTELAKWLDEKGLGAQDIDVELGKQAWQELYSGPGGKDRFGKDVDKRGKLPWRITGQYSEATAPDPRLTEDPFVVIDDPKESISRQETPIGLSTRRRANSLPETRKAVQQVRKANQGVPRSFIRTWVRMLPSDSDELVKAGLVS